MSAMRQAIVNGTSVENIILADQGFEVEGRILVPIPDDIGVSIGWVYSDGSFSPPSLPEPSTDPADYDLLPWQFTAMVNYLGIDPAIRKAIAAIPDPMMKAAALARYEKATSYRYADPIVEQLRAAIQLPTQDLIGAWLLAKDLRSSN